MFSSFTKADDDDDDDDDALAGIVTGVVDGCCYSRLNANQGL